VGLVVVHPTVGESATGGVRASFHRGADEGVGALHAACLRRDLALDRGAGFVVDSPYPDANANEIDPRAEAAEVLLQSTLADVREILKVTGIAPKRIALYTAPSWKLSVHELARGLAAQGALSMNVLMEKALAQPGIRERAKEVAAYAKQV